jgi:type IV pilus assembly protein PilB
MTDHGSHLRPAEPSETTEQRVTIEGVTAPRRRRGSGRFVTDVLVDRGFTDPERVARAIEEGRLAGVSPERVLLDEHAITPEQLSLAIAERYGLDHIDLATYKSTWRPPTSLPLFSVYNSIR